MFEVNAMVLAGLREDRSQTLHITRLPERQNLFYTIQHWELDEAHGVESWFSQVATFAILTTVSITA